MDDLGQSEASLFALDVLALESRVEQAEGERTLYRDMLFASLELLNRAAQIIANQQSALANRVRVDH